jgi:tetratricopeptide (TPR) repeat protein/transposase-like protein
MTSFIALADLLPAFPTINEVDQHKLVAAIKRWLEQCQQPWLLIFDNADDLPLVQEYFPTAGNGSILLTTRVNAVGSRASSLEVETLGFLEGTQFLLRRAHRLAGASEEAINEAGNIVVALDHFPLALDQAGAYIEETGCSFSDYLQLYHERRQVLLARRGAQATSYPDSVATTWSLSFQRVEQANPAAAELLRLCAFLAPDHIPEELFKEGAAHWPPVLQQASTDLLAFNQVLEELLRFSLMKRQAEHHLLSLHRLVQVVQRDALPPEEQGHWAERVVRAVHTLFPADPRTVTASWPQCLRYLEQAQACDGLIQEYGLLFPEAAELLDRAGVYLYQHASYSLAERLYQRALQIREQCLGREHPHVAYSLDNLAELYYEQKQYAKVELLLERACAIEERQLGPEHLDVAITLNNLASLYRDQGKDTEAEALFQRALRIKEQQLGPEHPKVASSLNNLAMLYLKLRRYVEAESLLQRARSIAEHQLGMEHPHVIFPLLNLGELCLEQGRYVEAESLLQRARSIAECQLGAEHPQVAFVLTRLAKLSLEQGNYQEAEPLYQHALTIQEQALGPHHPDTAETLHGFATLRTVQNNPLEAVSLYQRALTIWEQAYGPQHAKTVDTRERLHAVSAVLEKTKEVERHKDGQREPVETKDVEKNAEVSGDLRSGLPSCPHCQSNSAVVKSGANQSGSRRFRCQRCQRYFTPQAAARGYERTRKEQAVLLAGQGKSYRFIARQVGVNHRTIRAWLKASERDGDGSQHE